MSEFAVANPNLYWGDRLEVNTVLVQARHRDDEYMRTWVDGLTLPCRAILIGQLGISPALAIHEVQRAILARREELLPFLLAEAAADGKRLFAIMEVARSKLSADEIARARRAEGDDQPDRNALMWLLYLHEPSNLELVFYLDRMQRKGFARMVLKRTPARKRARNAAELFRRQYMQRMLDAYEQENRTRRESHCAAVLDDGHAYKVFIKRDHTPAFVSNGAKNFFGFRREWIILDFDADLSRVRICSISPDVPLLLANRIASEYFGEPVAYTNEQVATPTEAIAAFLERMLCEPGKMPLVEVTARNGGLDGSPLLRLSDHANEPLASAIYQLADAFGSPLEVIADIDSIKVSIFGKRVRLTFERAGEDDTEFVVRYAEQRLNIDERRTFERLMEHDYGIAVLSSEKKHAR